MSQGMIKLNKAKCLACGDILISNASNKWETCSCGSLSIGGGAFFIERKGTNFREMSQMIDLTELNPNENICMSPPKQ
jgi:hypothetical protein